MFNPFKISASLPFPPLFLKTLSSPLSKVSNCFPRVKSAYGLLAITKSPAFVTFAINRGDVTVVNFVPVIVLIAVFTNPFISYEIPFPVSVKLGSNLISPLTLRALNRGVLVVTSTYAPLTITFPTVERVPPIAVYLSLISIVPSGCITTAPTLAAVTLLESSVFPFPGQESCRRGKVRSARRELISIKDS